MVNKSNHRTMLHSGAAAALLAFAAPLAVQAQEATYNFNLPAQDLAVALRGYASVSRQQVSFDGGLVRGKTSAELVGTFTADEGLRKLLGGSGLTFRRGPSGVIVVEAAGVRKRAAFSVPSIEMKDALRQIANETGTQVRFDPDAVVNKRSTAVKSAKSADQAVVQAIAGLDLAVRHESDGSLTVFAAEAATSTDIVVIARRDEAETNYRVDMASTSTRTGETLKELPQSTAVVSDLLMKDQQVQSILEAVQNVAGATAHLTGGQGLTSFTVRGFGVSGLTNGLVSLDGTSQPVANVERVEVLKGPAAILAGRDNLGGTINVVTKRPVAQPLFNVALEYQTGDDRKVTVDAADAFNAGKTLSGRFVGEAAAAARNDGGYSGRDEYLYAPSLRFKNAYSDLIVGMDSTRQFTPTVAYTFIDATSGAILQRPNEPIGSDRQGADVRSHKYYYDFTQSIADWLTLVSRGEHYNFNLVLTPFLPLGYAGPPAGRYAYFQQDSKQNNTGNSADTYARIRVETAGVVQTMIAGVNYSQYELTQFDARSNFLMLNVLGPNPPAPPTPPLLTPASFVLNYSQEGLYLQDLLDYGRFHVVAAVRRNRYNVDIAFPARPSRYNQGHKSGTIPSFGAVFDVTPDVSVYANYMRGYSPTTAITFDGTVLPDIETQNIEAGVKADIADRRASLVVDVFRLRQDNRFVTDPLHPAFNIDIPGGQKATGAEATLTGRILSRLNVNATYSYTDYRFANSQAATQALLKVVNGVPTQTFGLFARYEQPSGPLHGLGGALGVFGNTKSYVDTTGRYTVPGGVEVNTNLYYTWGGARFNLGIKNIFDTRLYGVASTIGFVPIQDGRRVVATFSYRFF